MGLAGWMRARRTGSARDEGLAAGTGLITGHLADEFRGAPSPGEVDCPACGHRATFTDVIDLVERRTHHHCEICRHRWAVTAGTSSNSH